MFIPGNRLLRVPASIVVLIALWEMAGAALGSVYKTIPLGFLGVLESSIQGKMEPLTNTSFLMASLFVMAILAGIYGKRMLKNLLSLRITIFFSFILIWELAGIAAGRVFMPRPVYVINTFVRLVQGEIPLALVDSLFVLVVGFAISVVVGLFLGLILGAFVNFGRALEGYIHIFNAVPRVVWIPLVILWLGIFAEAKIFYIFIVAVFPLLINTYVGVANADPDLIELGRSLGASRRQIFMKIMIPNAAPMIMAGLKLAGSFAVLGVVLAEMFTAATGLGFRLLYYGNLFKTEEYFSYVIVISLIALVVIYGLTRIEGRFARWKRYEVVF